MTRIRTLFLLLTIVGPLHMAEQMLTRIDEFHAIRALTVRHYYGLFDPASAECEPGLWAGYDLARAKELVADYAADGNSVAITLLGNTAIQGELEFIQQTLETIGLDVTINAVPAAEWLPKINAGEFDISWYATSQPITASTADTAPVDSPYSADHSLPL